MTLRHVLLACALAVPLMAAGCSSDRETAELDPGGSTSLTLACQTSECECINDSKGIFYAPEKAPLIWEENGKAACPAGYKLKRIEADFLGRKK